MAKKYIDAEKLIHDLEERIFAYSEGYAEGDDNRKDAIETLLKDVKYQCSLQHEQQEVDLEKEIEQCWQNWLSPSNQKEVEGALPKTEFTMYARHFYELGKNSK